MNELSLFTGAGGGVLGSKILGHRIIGYVEYEKYCQEILKQRIADGILDAAPIFGDIRKFNSEGYAMAYSGMVDVLTGGFPCQPFSVAGKRAGEDDPRNMWPATIECVRLVRPRYAFFENVPGLLSSGYFDRILSDLAESGYDARWTCLGADDVGANHRRKRLWILAYTKCLTWTSGINRKILLQNNEIKREQGEQEIWGQNRVMFEVGQTKYSVSAGWKYQPDPMRMDNGITSILDRLKAIGNGQVPLAMARAFQILSQGIIK